MIFSCGPFSERDFRMIFSRGLCFRMAFPNGFQFRIRMRHFPKIVSAWDIRMSQVSEWEARMGFAQSSRCGFLKPDK